MYVAGSEYSMVIASDECQRMLRTWDVYVAGFEYSMAMASDECQRMLEDVGRVCCRTLIFNGLWQEMSAKECWRTKDVYVAGSEYSMAKASDECQRMLEEVGRVCCRIQIFNGYGK